MSNVLIRDLDDETIGRLKELAKINERSLSAELRVILTAIAAPDKSFLLPLLESASTNPRMRLLREVSDRAISNAIVQTSDSGDLQREDRDK